MPATENITTDITVSDIQLILQMIEVCAKRGAFHPAEFVAIGNLTKKLQDAIAPAKNETVEEPQLEFEL